MQAYPKQIAAKFVQQEVGDELLLYNEHTHRAFSLNATAASVWKACNGRRSVEELTTLLAATHGPDATAEIVEWTLAELERDGLLEARSGALPGETTRRAMIGTLGMRAALLLPVVAVVLAPTAAQAYSGCVDCMAEHDHALSLDAATTASSEGRSR